MTEGREPPARQPREGREGRADRAWDALPWIVFAALLAVSWQRWVQPFQDHGRELGTALRLAHGQVLYRDFLYLFGPLPPYADAALLRLFGERLGVLVAERLLLSAAGVLFLQRLAKRIGPASAANAGVALAIAACAFLPNGCWIFPYGAAALWGSVGAWAALDLALGASAPAASFAAATVAGLAAGTKIEFLPAALVAVAIPLLHRRPLGEAIAASGWATLLGVAAYAVPPLLLGRVALRLGPLDPTLHEPPFFRALHVNAFLSGTSPADFVSGGWARIFLPSLPFLLVALLLAQLPGRGTALRGGFLFLTGLAAALTFHPNEMLHVLGPLAIALAALVWGTRLVRGWSARPDAASSAALGAALVMLPALAREPLLYGFRPYAAFAFPLAYVFTASELGRRVRLPSVLALFLFGLAAGQVRERWRDYRAYRAATVETPRGTMVLEEHEAALVTRILDDLARLVPPSGRVAVLPETGVFEFLSGRMPALPRESFYPDHFGTGGEDDVIAALSTTPPSAVVLVNRESEELGGRRLGVDFYVRFWRALEPHLRLVEEIGPAWGTTPPRGAKATSARVYRYVP